MIGDRRFPEYDELTNYFLGISSDFWVELKYQMDMQQFDPHDFKGFNVNNICVENVQLRAKVLKLEAQLKNIYELVYANMPKPKPNP